MINLFLDFETHWGSEYSLSNMTTTEYIHDPRFEIQGVGIKVDTNKTRWYPGGQAEDVLHEFDWSQINLIGHNLNFDASILAFKFGFHPAQLSDTASMARVVLPFLKSHSLASIAAFYQVGTKNRAALVSVKDKRLSQITEEQLEALGAYCISDVDNTAGIYGYMRQSLDDKEMELMHITNKMMTTPRLQLDPVQLKNLIKEKRETRDQLIEASGLSIKTLRSTPQLVRVLENLNAEIPRKPSPSDPDKEIPTFQRDLPQVVALTQHPNRRVRDVINARLEVMSSIDLNRAKRMLAIYEATGGDFPIPLKHAGAHTLRWSGSDKINAQNFTRGPIRKSIVAPEHHDVVVADLGQIEARLTAWLAEHLKLLKQFADPDIDVYSEQATEVYNKDVEDITYDERFVGKTLILSAGFGVGWKKLHYMFSTKAPHLKVTEAQAANMIDAYRTTNYPIVRLWDYLNNCLIRMMNLEDGEEFGYKCLTFGKGYVRLPSGNHLYYPELRYEMEEDDYGNERPQLTYTHKGNPTRIYGGRFTENLIQALARCVIAEQMRQINKTYPVSGMAHDELILVTHKSVSQAALAHMEDVMSTSPVWAPDLPLSVEGDIAPTYGDAK